MKKITLSLIMSMLVMFAVAQEKLYLHKTNGEVVEYAVSEVKYIDFAEEATDTPDFNGHEYVDLGLPSGTLWATCNVGAETPEGYGDYFAWGETESKTSYNWSTYKWCDGRGDALTKYCADAKQGTVDNKTVLELSDDAARANWGGDWRIPTLEEFEELIDTDNCTLEWVELNGISGYQITSKTNGNSIFLPASGYFEMIAPSATNDNGYYWINSLNDKSSDMANELDFNVNGIDYNNDYRYYGTTIRPVMNIK